MIKCYKVLKQCPASRHHWKIFILIKIQQNFDRKKCLVYKRGCMCFKLGIGRSRPASVCGYWTIINFPKPSKFLSASDKSQTKLGLARVRGQYTAWGWLPVLSVYTPTTPSLRPSTWLIKLRRKPLSISLEISDTEI